MNTSSILQALRNHPFRVLFFVLFFVGLIIGYNQFTGYQNIIIEQQEPTSGAVQIYKVTITEDKQQASPQELIDGIKPTKEVEGSGSIRVRKGDYVVVGGTSSDFNLQLQKVAVFEQPVTVIIDPPYSTKRLNALLEAERPTIQAAILAQVPTIQPGYLLGPGQLFGKGEWYGTVIYPNLSDEERRLNYVDVYHVVAKKENGTWKVMTVPPEIILSAPVYPDIPRDVLIGTNNQQQPN